VYRAKLSLLCLLIICSYTAASEKLGVVDPLVREPFSRVYSDIVAGIKDSYPGEVINYPVNGDLSHLQNADNLPGEKVPGMLIALGNKSLNATKGINIPVIAALSKAPADRQLNGIIILKPSAATYLSRLLALYPTVKTVHVVYNAKEHNHLIEEARDYLKKKNKYLNAIPASDIRGSALGFRKIVDSAHVGDAIWLIADGGLIDSSILSRILDSAWDKRLAVFSSNPQFVKRGALFAIYPDNFALGQRLAKMAVDLSQPSIAGNHTAYLEDVKIAYNDRTGDHIGIKLSSETKTSIDLILPDQ
jgi:ABC transporter substrate binding protein